MNSNKQESWARWRTAKYGYPWLDVKVDRGKRFRRAIFMWVAFFGPLPRGWRVHHLRPADTLSDFPLWDTLALPHGAHVTVHRVLNRTGQQAQVTLNHYRAYWLDYLRAG
jgi:hypothetical protein